MANDLVSWYYFYRWFFFVAHFLRAIKTPPRLKVIMLQMQFLNFCDRDVTYPPIMSHGRKPRKSYPSILQLALFHVKSAQFNLPPPRPRRWSFSKKRSEIPLLPNLRLISIMVGWMLIIYPLEHATIWQISEDLHYNLIFCFQQSETWKYNWISHMSLPEVRPYCCQHLHIVFSNC